MGLMVCGQVGDIIRLALERMHSRVMRFVSAQSWSHFIGYQLAVLRLFLVERDMTVDSAHTYCSIVKVHAWEFVYLRSRNCRLTADSCVRACRP